MTKEEMTLEKETINNLYKMLEFLERIEKAESIKRLSFEEYAESIGKKEDSVSPEIPFKGSYPEKPKKHSPREFFDRTIKKSFIPFLIVGIALLVIGSQCFLISFAAIKTFFVLFIIGLVLALALLITGLILLMKGLREKKKYSNKII